MTPKQELKMAARPVWMVADRRATITLLIVLAALPEISRGSEYRQWSGLWRVHAMSLIWILP